MIIRKELLRFKSLTLNHETEPDDDIIKAIKNTILGNPDGMRYRHLDSLKKIKEIKPLQFFTLRKDNALLFVMALVERITSLGDNYYYTYNVRYVTFNQFFAAKTLTLENNPSGLQKLGNSFIKEGMRKHAESFEFTLHQPESDSKKRIYYAYVEESNLRSMNFTGFFFEPIRKFTVITYSSIYPKANTNIKKLTTEELPDFKKQLNGYYKNHSFYFTDDTDLLNNYYVIEEKGKIVAGVRAQIANWKLEQLPGKTGKFLIKVLPHFPVLSRIIKPDRFTFITFDTIYCSEGNDYNLSNLFESVCALLKVYAAMIYIDKEDEMYSRISKLKKMGILNKLFKKANGVVLARFVNFTDEEKSEFYSSPVYLSGYDMT